MKNIFIFYSHILITIIFLLRFYVLDILYLFIIFFYYSATYNELNLLKNLYINHHYPLLMSYFGSIFELHLDILLNYENIIISNILYALCYDFVRVFLILVYKG
jgi:hypothetical protein